VASRQPAVPARQPRADADDVRQRLIDAALQEFAAVGFEGASTRRIAAVAETHQPQINYHFESKLGLWKATIDALFEEMDEALADMPRDPVQGLIETSKRFTRFAARRPELNRIMVHESTVRSERLLWIVDRHVRHRFAAVSSALRTLDPATVPTTDPVIFYYSLVGASSLLSVNAPEVELLTGCKPTPESIDAHADAVARMLFGPYAR
jgi:TetR/AcrR family transcriptional regulator